MTPDNPHGILVPGSKYKPGVPSSYMSRIKYLSNLFKHLPEHLPLQLELSTSSFLLDPSDISEKGYYCAFINTMGRCFQTHLNKGDGKIQIKERGPHLQDCITIIKTAAKYAAEEEREMIRDCWVEQLIAAAKEAGAKIPSPRYDMSCCRQLKQVVYNFIKETSTTTSVGLR